MGDSKVAMIKGFGQVDLKFTSGNVLALNEVQLVQNIRRNLVSGSLLIQVGYKLVFESNKVIITKFGSFIGRGYLCDGLFKLNIVDASTIRNECDYPVVLMTESCDVWHARLGHVNLNSVRKLMSIQLIPKTQINNSKKCEICVQAKLPRKPFKSV